MEELERLSEEENKLKSKVNEASLEEDAFIDLGGGRVGHSKKLEECEKELEDFYKRKNEIALKFIKDVNSGKISTEDFEIHYLIRDFDGSYYYEDDDIDYSTYNDEILIGDKFRCYPSRIIQMEEGSKEVYDFLDKHIDSTVYISSRDDDGDYEPGGPFPWSDGKISSSAILSSKRMDYYKNSFNRALKKFSECITDDIRITIDEKIAALDKKFEENILHDMKQYNLTQEQADFLENFLDDFQRYADSDIGENLANLKNISAKIIEMYGIETFENLRNAVDSVAEIEFDENEQTLEEYMYNNVSEKEQNWVIADLKLTDDIFTEVSKSTDENKIIALSRNENLTILQALTLKDRALSTNKSEILENLIKRIEFDETTIREMFNGSETEKNAIMLYCKNIPEDLIQTMLDDPRIYEKNDMGRYRAENIYGLLNVLKNNQKLSVGLIEQFKKYSDEVATGYGKGDDFEAGLLAQENITMEMVKEVAERGSSSSVVVDSFLQRENKDDEMIEAFANHKWYPAREAIAEAVTKGEIKVNEETFRKLALDRKIDESIRMKLLAMPEFKENISQKDETSEELKIQYRNIRYGGDGPGSFDNRGGCREFTVNQVGILLEPAFTNSYGETIEERKWASNAYTDFSYSTDLESFKQYCNDHKREILHIVSNGEMYEDFNHLKERVEMIKKELEQIQSHDLTHEMSEIEDVISDRELETINSTTAQFVESTKEKQNEGQIQGD